MTNNQRIALVRQLSTYLADLSQALGVSVEIKEVQDNSREGKWFPVVTMGFHEWSQLNADSAKVALSDIKAMTDHALTLQLDGSDFEVGSSVGPIISDAEFEALMQPATLTITTLDAKAEMFTRVSEMNEAFGNPKGDMANIDWDRIESQVKCIPEEVDEALEAIAARDLPALRDALCDIPVFSLGAQHLAGIDGAADMDIVIDANMTRLITNADQLARTMKKYADMGLVTYVVGEFPTMALKSARTQRVPTGIGSNTADFPKDKFLKCVDFKEPVFEMPAQQTLPLDEPNPMSAAMSEDAQFNGGNPMSRYPGRTA